MKNSLWIVPAFALMAPLFAGCAAGAGSSSFTPSVSAAAPAPLQQAAMSPVTTLVTAYISKATAQKIALAAVHGGTVTLSVLETNDRPVHWSIDITNRTGDYEVWVDARTGKVLAIIRG